MACGTGVQQQSDGGVPGLFLATHHEIVMAGTGAPVHSTQVVPLAVLTHQDVILALGTDLAGVEDPDLPAPASELSGARGCTLGVTMRWLTVRKEWSA